jgi:protein DGCR14
MAGSQLQVRDDAALMLPPPPRLPKGSSSQAVTVLPGEAGHNKVVLPEDDYAAGVEAIIERDYFPDIPKLRNQLEWAKAVNSGDPAQIRAAQINIARRRAGLMTPVLGGGAPATGARLGTQQTPGGWGTTPGTAVLRTPAMTPLAEAGVGGLASASAATPALHARAGAATPGPISATAALQQAAVTGEVSRAPPMSLDTFLATHTSEDNASFAKIQDKHIARKRARYEHLLDGKSTFLALPSNQQQGGTKLLTSSAKEDEFDKPARNPADPIEEYGSSGQGPMTLTAVPFNPTNALFYVPDQKPLSLEEAGDLARQPAKYINIKGTRVKAQGEEEAAGAAAAPGTTGTGAPGPAAPAAAGGAGGQWNRLSTPALTPGGLGDASPFMTWGDIASTPLRLDGVEEGVLDENALVGPSFAVPDMPNREKVRPATSSKSSEVLLMTGCKPNSNSRGTTTYHMSSVYAWLNTHPSVYHCSQVGHQLAAAKTIGNLRRLQKATQREEEARAAGLPPGAGAALAGGLSGLAPRSGTRTPGAGAGTPLTGALAKMSPAAHKLAHALKAKKGASTPGGSDMDRMLRATYSGLARGATPGSTPSRTPGSTPSLAPPRAQQQAGAATPVLVTGGHRPAGAPGGKTVVSVGALAAAGKGLTDGLLKI